MTKTKTPANLPNGAKLIGTRAIREGGQDQNLHSRWEIGTGVEASRKRITIEIHIDVSYAIQSHVCAKVWAPDSLSWNVVATMVPGEWPAMGRGPEHDALMEVEAELLRRAAWALGTK